MSDLSKFSNISFFHRLGAWERENERGVKMFTAEGHGAQRPPQPPNSREFGYSSSKWATSKTRGMTRFARSANGLECGQKELTDP